MLHPDARIFSHHASKDPVPPRGTLDRFLLRTEQTGWAVLYVELPRPERELDAAEQGRVRVGLEVGIGQVRDLPRMPVQLQMISLTAPSAR